MKENWQKILEATLSTLPESPGCYQFYGSEGNILYVGKAKDLKKRVNSYFNKTHESPKLRVLVKRIREIRYIVVKTEEDALLLENSLIKEYQPRYNAQLKDDKSYPFIVVRNEMLPRVYATRQVVQDGSSYYGPYTSVTAMKTILASLRDIYPLRTCGYVFTPENIQSKKYPVCLEYHIKRCLGPCQGYQSVEDYNKNITEIKEILGGNVAKISKQIRQEMLEHAENWDFEKAEKCRKKAEMIERYKQKSEIVNPKLHNLDVFSIEENNTSSYINYLHIFNGTIIRAYTIEYKNKIETSTDEILSLGIVELRERFRSQAKEIIVPFIPEMCLEGVHYTVPQKGDKKTLLELSQKNAKQYKVDQLKRNEKLNPEQRTTQLLKDIQDKLHLPKLPMVIECFDNSNIQGTSAVAACVVYRKGKPAKKDYRKYHIKTVEGPDDYASMREVVRRRYSRFKEEDTPLPDLIVADGGAGQMETIRKVVEDELHLSIPIAGLAKDNKHKTNEILMGFPPQVITLIPTDRVFHFFGNMQEEVHRFAIEFHKNIRSKKQVHSELDTIAGIGEKSKTELIKAFKSVNGVRKASLEELSKVIGTNRASRVYEHFRAKLTAPE